MKNFYSFRLSYIIIFFLFTSHCIAQTGDWGWVKGAGGMLHDVSNSITTDLAGNVYITGYYKSDSMDFGTIVLPNDSGSLPDIFIAKYDASGNLLWVKSTGGQNDDVENNIFVDRNTNIYLTGYFGSDSIAFGNTVLKNSGGNKSDIFTVKMDSAGNALWAKSAGGTDQDVGYSICV